MASRFALLAAPLLIALAPAASAQPTPPAQTAKAGRVDVVLNTDLGKITLELDTEHAPITSANFLRYVDQKRFDGIVFYRVMRLNWGQQPNGLVQAGTRGDPKRVLKPIAHEPTSKTGILHKAGAVSMARFAPGTATGDFSILLSDLPSLDANPTATDPEALAGFAAFGHVIEGMDVVRKIYDVPLSPTAGVGILKGQMIEKPVKILTVRRVPVPKLTTPP